MSSGRNPWTIGFKQPDDFRKAGDVFEAAGYTEPGIVEYLGGQINILSKLDEGTTFRVYLPGVKVKSRVEQLEEEDALAVS